MTVEDRIIWVFLSIWADVKKEGKKQMEKYVERAMELRNDVSCPN
jgi:hypothetical protein